MPETVTTIKHMTEEQRIKKIEEFCETEGERSDEEWEKFMTAMENDSK